MSIAINESFYQIYCLSDVLQINLSGCIPTNLLHFMDDQIAYEIV